MWEKCKNKFYRFLRLQNAPVIKIYTGYGNGSSFQVFGHILSLSPIDRKKYRNGVVRNTLALLRLFFVKPIRNAAIDISFEGKIIQVVSEKDGFIKAEWTEENILPPGTYKCSFSYFTRKKIGITSTGMIIVPQPTTYACISDIDDTFLVSHSANLRKRLYVLFTENAKSRKPFKGAVRHYRLLAGIDDEDQAHNSFFYVSSSEWNLYTYIQQFISEQDLPRGVMLLSQMKTFSSLLTTGQGNHQGKFVRITKILQQFPGQKFVLLGDDTQQDPFIYKSIVEHFKQNIICVYIRRVGTPVKDTVLEVQHFIEAKGVKFYYFSHSEDAIAHSIQIGLLRPEAIHKMTGLT